MRIVIFERVLTHYRLKFFNFLCKNHNLKIVFLTKEIPKREGFNTDKNLANFEIIKLKNFSLFGLEFYFIPFEILKSNRHFIFLLSFKSISNFIYLVITRLSGKKFYWWGHSKNFSKNTFFSRLSDKIKIKLINYSRGVLAYTDLEKKRFIDKKIKPNKIIVLNNTVDTSNINDINEKLKLEKLDQIKTKYDLSSKVVIGLIGRLHKLRNCDIAIETFLKLKKKYNNISLLIIGGGTELQSLKERFKNKDVNFIGSIENEKELAPIINNIDFFINPGLVGLNIIHCMAYGKPTITIQRDFHSPEIDYLQCGINGFISKDEKDFYLKIEELINDSVKLYNLSKNCLKKSKKLSIDNMAKNFINII